MDSPTPGRPARPYAPTALPSVWARVLAFAAIVVGGLSGGVIGWALVDLQCSGRCGGPTTLGAVVGALAGAGGVGVIAVLVLRAMAEWRRPAELP